MGRKAKPTGVKLFEGKYISPNSGEPSPDSIDESYPPPATLGELGRQKWSEIVSLLKPLRVLTVVDTDALEIYCLTWQEVADCDADIEKDGAYQATDGGRLIAHPAVHRRQNALDRIRRYQQEFGMTPASRSRVDIGAALKQQPHGKLAKYAD